MIDNRREPGFIEGFHAGKQDHGIPTVSIYFHYDNGGIQGFGGLHFGNDENLLKDFIDSICYTFNVHSLEQLKGKRGYALKCFGNYNETIEGLEDINGHRFTLTSWRKRHNLDPKSPLDNKKDLLLSNIVNSKRIQDEAEAELKVIDKLYKDWG